MNKWKEASIKEKKHEYKNKAWIKEKNHEYKEEKKENMKFV